MCYVEPNPRVPQKTMQDAISSIGFTGGIKVSKQEIETRGKPETEFRESVVVSEVVNEARPSSIALSVDQAIETLLEPQWLQDELAQHLNGDTDSSDSDPEPFHDGENLQLEQLAIMQMEQMKRESGPSNFKNKLQNPKR